MFLSNRNFGESPNVCLSVCGLCRFVYYYGLPLSLSLSLSLFLYLSLYLSLVCLAFVFVFVFVLPLSLCFWFCRYLSGLSWPSLDEKFNIRQSTILYDLTYFGIRPFDDIRHIGIITF